MLRQLRIFPTCTWQACGVCCHGAREAGERRALPTEPDPGPGAPHHTWIVLMETCVLLLECYFPFIFPSSHLAPGNDIPVARLKSLPSMMTQRLNSMG